MRHKIATIESIGERVGLGQALSKSNSKATSAMMHRKSEKAKTGTPFHFIPPFQVCL